MKRTEWQASRRAEQDYAAALWNAWIQAGKGVTGGIVARALSTGEFLAAYARQAALRMVTGVYFQGARTWREAARESGRTAQLYAALQKEMSGPVGARVRELVRRNAELISTFPSIVARRAVASGAAAQALAGGRAEEFRGWLTGVARSRAQLIARTEVGKASAALTQARAEELDLPWYVWRTSQDERVRASHRKMDGVLFRYDDPPAPEALAGIKSNLGHYHAGEAPNCRCYAEPVVRFERLSWPRRCYINKRIQSLTLAQFKLFNQISYVA